MVQEIRRGVGAQTFGVPYFNETYVRWFYRVIALEHNLCFKDQRYQVRSMTTNRSYNTLEHSSTSDLARDIDLLRAAIGAQKMSVFGVSYGTKVGSVYATLFPDRVHRLILDGNMGADPDIETFAGWVGQSTEAVWTGLASACDNSALQGGPPETICPAAPGVTAKLHKLWQGAATAEERSNALALFGALSQVIYSPGVPCASHLMKCMADVYASGNISSAPCRFFPLPNDTCTTMPITLPSGGLSYPGTRAALGLQYPPTNGGLDVIGSVLGLDLAGRLTEESFIEWWRSERSKQPLGITRSLGTTAAVGAWPAMPRPQPPAGDPVVAPLVIGNLFDGQTPYKMAQRMHEAFPSGRLLTSQFYGHGMQGPRNVTAVVKRYEDEMKRGVPPTYDDDVAKLMCVKVALEYLKDGTLARDYVCKAAGPVRTGPGLALTGREPSAQILV